LFVILVQLAVPGSRQHGQLLNILPRQLFVSLHTLFYDIVWSEYMVHKMQVGFHLSSEKVSAKQSKTAFLPGKMESFTKWSNLGYFELGNITLDIIKSLYIRFPELLKFYITKTLCSLTHFSFFLFPALCNHHSTLLF
jgi:hypothetical protein